MRAGRNCRAVGAWETRYDQTRAERGYECEEPLHVNSVRRVVCCRLVEEGAGAATVLAMRSVRPDSVGPSTTYYY